VENETSAGWCARQLVGAANITGSPLFHLISGNLGYQVEHHLYPDMPSSRYSEIAPRVRDICQRYGLPYNTGPLSRQLGSVHRNHFAAGVPRRSPSAQAGPLSAARRRRDHTGPCDTERGLTGARPGTR
jgi:fatty acid desaturase